MTKVMSPEAAASLVPGRASLGIGGLQGNYPMATIRALSRREDLRLDLLVGPPVGMAGEILVAANRVTRIAAPYMGAESTIPVAPAFRARVESGDLKVWECDEGILLAGLRAAGQGLPYLPWRGGVGTSLPKLNPDLVEVHSRETGTLLHVPALPLDVAIIRGLEADPEGNVRYHKHSFFADPAICRAARTVIVEVERIVDHRVVLDDPSTTVVHRADAVVVAPFGSHPFRAAGLYRQDEGWLADYSRDMAAALLRGDDPSSAPLLRREIAVSSHEEYLDLVGIDRLSSLIIDQPSMPDRTWTRP